MEIFLKATAGILICAVFCLFLAKQGKDISLLLSILACTMAVIAAITFINPILSFISKLQVLAQWKNDMLKILLKAVGIGLISEVTALICNDAGNAALGKSLQILATCAILWLSLPLITELVELLEKILGAI